MAVARSRTFTLTDAMIAIAGFALSLLARVEGYETIVADRFRMLMESSSALQVWIAFQVLMHHGQPMIAIWTLTILVIGLCHQRPNLRRLASRPGIAACSAAMLAFVIVGPLRSFNPGISVSPSATWTEAVHIYASSLFFKVGAECGVAVIGAWSVLILGGRWRVGSDLVDRAGLAMGCFWIAMIPVTYLGPCKFR